MALIPIYSVIIGKIQTTLNSIAKVKEVFLYPAQNLTQFPSVIVLPNSIDNNFETNQDNFKTYTFKLFAVVNANQKNLSDIYSTVMPNLLDAILQQFDNDWDTDAIDGHRSWMRIETGVWTVSEEKQNLQVTAELDLSIKVLTTNQSI